jgi:hypothetical protein
MTQAPTKKLQAWCVSVTSPRGGVQVYLRDGRIELDFQEATENTWGVLWPEEHTKLAGLLGCSEAEAVKVVELLSD